MLLTEERASELIADWTAGSCAELTFTGKDLRLVVGEDYAWPTSIQGARERALGVRRLLEGLNALTTCGGFDPEENPAFWLREMTKLGECSPHRFSRDLFARYDIEADFTATDLPSVLAFGCVTCLSMDPASSAMGVRHQVIGQLRHYMLTMPPALDLRLRLTHSVSNFESWHNLSDALCDFAHVMSLVSTSSDPERVKVVTGDHYGNIEPINCYYPVAKLIKWIGQSLGCLLEFHCSYPDNRDEFLEAPYRFDGIMRALADIDTVEAMSWTLESVTKDDAAILFSAVSNMDSLQSLTVDRLGASTDSLALFDWLAFALRRRQLRGLQLCPSISINQQEAEAFTRAMTDNRLCERLIPAHVREMTDFVYFPLGTTVKPAPNTHMTSNLLAGRLDSDPVVANGTRLTVVAQSGAKCIVVVPGGGLMWIATNALSAWEYPSDQKPPSLPHALRAMSFIKSEFRDVMLVMQHVGADGYDFEGSIKPSDMDSLSRCGGSLRAIIETTCDLSSFGRLLTRFAATLQSVSVAIRWSSGYPYAYKSLADPSPFFDALINPTGACQLRELYVASIDLTADAMEVLAVTLATNRRLQLVVLQSSATEGELTSLEKRHRDRRHDAQQKGDLRLSVVCTPP